MSKIPPPSEEDIKFFQKLIDEQRYDFEKLVYTIFPFGQKGHELENKAPYDWQLEEWRKLSLHLANPSTRYEAYRLIISSGNGAAKTAFGAMTFLMVMYTQRLRARITANTEPQMRSIVWPEYDKWFRHARFHEHFFEKFGSSIKAKKHDLAETWRLDAVQWDEQRPASISGLHNEGYAIMYIFEEAPGIPAIIWDYASGAFTEKNTIKIHLAFGNSDDPESKFEQNMESKIWNSKRIDTRTLEFIDPNQIKDWLIEYGGDEDADEFRVRVRGLPRKAAKDSIISRSAVNAAIERGKDFDETSVRNLPCTLMCDPAWTGGDETTIAMRQGLYVRVLERFTLDKEKGQTHQYTYARLCHWEKQVQADAVFIDQGEGTAIYTLAQNQGKYWELVAFGSHPTDALPADSEYANARAQMYWETNKAFLMGGVITSEDPKWLEDIAKQLCWTKGSRHRITSKKLAEPKIDIRKRVGASPDLADVIVLGWYRPVVDRLPEHDRNASDDGFQIGGQPFKMPDHPDPYDDDYDLYD